MNEHEARESTRPRGNVTPLPRMQEPDGDRPAWKPPDSWAKGRSLGFDTAAEPPYPEGPLASRAVQPWEADLVGAIERPPMSEEQFAELARSVRQPGALTGVRLWMTWPGEPDVARELSRSIGEVAENLGFSLLDVQVGEMES